MKLYNATSHNQKYLEEKYRQLGFSFVNPAPMVKAVAPDYESQVKEGLRISEKIPEGSNVLIGGAQIIIEVLMIQLGKKNCRFYAALTDRKSDENGNFVFSLVKVEETYFSKALYEGKIHLKD